MFHEKLIERKIQEAVERGEFDNLSGRGRPLDLTDYFSTPEDRRLTYSVLKSSGFIPDEVRLLKELDQLRAALASASDASERAQLQRQIDESNLKFNLQLELHKRRRR